LSRAGSIILDNLGVLTHRLKVQTLAISPEHAISAGSLEWEHRDPFDRMLAAQCIIENMVLASKDSAFNALGDAGTKAKAGDDDRGSGGSCANGAAQVSGIKVLWA
jgi:hypothetical protein